MAQGQIRKGFFFYFGLFVLLLISVFMICLVVMMFNPGTPVLWMKYFTANEVNYVETTNDDAKSEINFASYSEVNIKCSYANVSVKRYRDNDLREDGLYIINKAIGFAGAEENTDFTYKVYTSGSVLNIELEEPRGFLYFSKNIEVLLLENTISDNQEASHYDFENLTINVETTDGNVQLGLPDAGSDRKDIKLKGVNAKTENGSILLGEMLDQSKIEECNLETNSGKIRVLREGEKGSTLDVNCAINLTLGTGWFGADYVDCDEFVLNCKTGTIDIGTLNSSATAKCVEGNYRFEKVMQNLSFDFSENTLKAPNISADYVGGDFDLSSVDGTPDVKLGEVVGKMTILAQKGRAVVKKACGAVEIDAEKNFLIEIAFCEGYANTATLTNDTDNVIVKLLGAFNGDLQIQTNKGNVIVKVTTEAGFKAEAYKNTGNKDEKVSDDKISVNVGLNAGEIRNPLTVEGVSDTSDNGKIVVITNAKIDYQLTDKASMQTEEVVA